jgi:hypothetical protein
MSSVLREAAESKRRERHPKEPRFLDSAIRPEAPEGYAHSFRAASPPHTYRNDLERNLLRESGIAS